MQPGARRNDFRITDFHTGDRRGACVENGLRYWAIALLRYWVEIDYRQRTARMFRIHIVRNNKIRHIIEVKNTIHVEGQKRLMWYDRLRRVEEGRLSKQWQNGAKAKAQWKPRKSWIDCVQENIKKCFQLKTNLR